MTEQTAAERAQQAHYDRLLREKARTMEVEARRVAAEMRRAAEASRRVLLGG